MQLQRKIIGGTLISIIVVGLVGIPMGDPRFFTNAIILETIFFVLAFLSFWRLKYAIIPNIIISIVVIVANTASPKHIEIMSSFEPLGNAIVLIIGGYLLQGLLLVANVSALKKQRRLKLSTN